MANKIKSVKDFIKGAWNFWVVLAQIASAYTIIFAQNINIAHYILCGTLILSALLIALPKFTK